MKPDSHNASAAPRPRHPKLWQPVLAAVVLAALLGGGWAMLHTGTEAAGKSDAPQERPQELGPSDFITVQADELRVLLPISGELTALSQATVKSKVAAAVTGTFLPEGIAASKGQVVMRLDSGDLQAQLQAQQAAQEDARARLVLAQKNLETSKALLRQKYISQTAYDAAESTVDIARAALKAASAQLDIARRARADADVRAPIDGIISRRFVQTGEKVSPDTPLFSIVDLKQMILEAQVPTNAIARVRPGQVASFDMEGFEDRHFSGTVARINPAAEAGSRTMTVYISVENGDGALRAGMFAKGNIILEKTAALPQVPLASLRQENGVDTVLKIEDGRIVSQPVELGLHDERNGMVAVVSGLQAGNRVISTKLDGVRAGTSVILPEAPRGKPSGRVPSSSTKG